MIEIGSHLLVGDAEAWQTLSVPLVCLEKAGADLAKIDTPFLLATAGQLSLDIARVTIAAPKADNPLAAALDADVDAQCQSWLTE